MPGLFVRLNLWLGQNMVYIILSGLAVGAVLPVEDSPQLRELIIGLFAYITFVSSLTTSMKKFLQVLRHPWVPLWILTLVHVVTPLVAYLIGLFFYPEDLYARIGYLVGASIPIGVTSLIWTSLVQGNVAVSLVAVMLDTFLVPFLMPLFFTLVLGKSVNVDYMKMIQDLVWMVSVPSLAGMFLHDIFKGRLDSFAKGVGGASSKVAFFFVIYINAALVLPKLVWEVSLVKMLLITLLVVASGYATGYLGSFALNTRSREAISTMIYNVGIRNNACGLVIALAYFPPAAAVPITLAILYQQPIATLIYRLFFVKAKPASV